MVFISVISFPSLSIVKLYLSCPLKSAFLCFCGHDRHLFIQLKTMFSQRFHLLRIGKVTREFFVLDVDPSLQEVETCL